MNNKHKNKSCSIAKKSVTAVYLKFCKIEIYIHEQVVPQDLCMMGINLTRKAIDYATKLSIGLQKKEVMRGMGFEPTNSYETSPQLSLRYSTDYSVLTKVKRMSQLSLIELLGKLIVLEYIYTLYGP